MLGKWTLDNYSPPSPKIPMFVLETSYTVSNILLWANWRPVLVSVNGVLKTGLVLEDLSEAFLGVVKLENSDSPLSHQREYYSGTGGRNTSTLGLAKATLGECPETAVLCREVLSWPDSSQPWEQNSYGAIIKQGWSLPRMTNSVLWEDLLYVYVPCDR